MVDSKLLAVKVGIVNPAWSAIVVANTELVETCTRYELAPLTAFQLNSGVILTPVAPLTGVASTGALGTGTDVFPTNRILST